MRISLLYILIVMSSNLFAQHYPLSTHYVVNGAVINPAYAGRNEVLDVTLAHRRQWVGVNGSPVNTCFSINAPMKRKQLNLGLSLLDDRIAVLSKQLFNVMFAYRLKVNKLNIAFGIQNGLLMERSNLQSLAKNDAQDNVITSNTPNRTGYVAGSGIYIHDRHFFAGISMPYMINTLSSGSFKDSPFICNAGYYFRLNSNNMIRVSALGRTVLGTSSQLEGGATYYFKEDLGIGLNYRSSNSLIGTVELEINKQARIYYAYDYGTGDLKKFSNGSHEIAIRYYFGYYTKATNPRDFR